MDMSAAASATAISVMSGSGLVLPLAVSPFVDALKSRGVSNRWSSGAAQSLAVCVAGCAMAAFPFIDASGPRLVLIALAFGGTAIAIPLHYMTTAEVVPPAQRGAVFGIVVGGASREQGGQQPFAGLVRRQRGPGRLCEGVAQQRQ